MSDFFYQDFHVKKFFTYMGSKRRLLPVIRSLLLKSDKSAYIEPFLGSGIIFLNLPKTYDKYVLNDIHKDLILIFKNAKNLSIEFCKDFFRNILKIYNLHNKKSWEDFKVYFNNETNEINRTLLFFLIMVTAINGMYQITPSTGKFTQGWGGQKIVYERFYECLDEIKNKKNLEVLNTSFIETFKDSNDSIYIFDPPYFKRQMGVPGLEIAEFTKLVDFMLNTKNHFIYFDNESDYSEILKSKFKFKYTNTATPHSPKGNINISEKEIMIWNF